MNWVDRAGRQRPLGLEPASYYVLDISPDGRSAAIEITEDTRRDVWLIDLENQTTTRRTFFEGIDSYPIWTPDATRLVWGRGESLDRDLFWQAVEGRERPGFALEAGQQIGVGGQLWMEDLDGDVSSQILVVGAIDLSHAAGTERAEDFVVAEPAPWDESHDADHRGPSGEWRGAGAPTGSRAW